MTRLVLAAATWSIAVLLLLMPLASLAEGALESGLGAVARGLSEPDTRAAIGLSCLVASIVVPINTVAGVFAAYALSKFRFSGRQLLLVLIELPLSVSPVVAGLVWVLLFGRGGWFGPFLAARDIQITFALPGILLATLFVTFPFVVRTMMPAMEAAGHLHEEAATMLGARFRDVLLRVTLPAAGWALASGVLLTAARALGEFGAVSVVSGHIPGVTETVPLRIETLYDDYATVSAFSLAGLLALASLVAVGLRSLLQWRHQRSLLPA